MQAETTKLQTQELKQPSVATSSVSVCQTPEEQYRLKKLFEIFIDIDKKINLLQKKNGQPTRKVQHRT